MSPPSEIRDSEDDEVFSDVEHPEDHQQPLPLLAPDDSLSSDAIRPAVSPEKKPHVPTSGERRQQEIRAAQAGLLASSNISSSHETPAAMPSTSSPTATARRPSKLKKDIFEFDDSDDNDVELVNSSKRKNSATTKKTNANFGSPEVEEETVKSGKRNPSTKSVATKKRTKSTPDPVLYEDDDFDPEVFGKGRSKKPSRAKTTDGTMSRRTRTPRAAAKEVNYQIPPLEEVFEDNSSPKKRNATPRLSAKDGLRPEDSSPTKDPSSASTEPKSNFVIDLSRGELVMPTQQKEEYDVISNAPTETSVASATTQPANDEEINANLEGTVLNDPEREPLQPTTSSRTVSKSAPDSESELELVPVPQSRKQTKKRAKTDPGLDAESDRSIGIVASEWRAAKGKSKYGEKRSRTFAAGDEAYPEADEDEEEEPVRPKRTKTKAKKQPARKTPARKKSMKAENVEPSANIEPTPASTSKQNSPASGNAKEFEIEGSPTNNIITVSLSDTSPTAEDRTVSAIGPEDPTVTAAKPIQVAPKRKRTSKVEDEEDLEDELAGSLPKKQPPRRASAGKTNTRSEQGVENDKDDSMELDFVPEPSIPKPAAVSKKAQPKRKKSKPADAQQPPEEKAEPPEAALPSKEAALDGSKRQEAGSPETKSTSATPKAEPEPDSPVALKDCESNVLTKNESQRGISKGSGSTPGPLDRKHMTSTPFRVGLSKRARIEPLLKIRGRNK